MSIFFHEKRDAENPGGGADLSPRLVGACRKKVAGCSLPSFEIALFCVMIYTAHGIIFAILTGV
jgi:hypothetical protein